MSLQTVLVTLGIGVAAVAAVAYAIFQQNQRYKTTNHNAYAREFRVIRQETCGVCLEEETSDCNILNCGHWIHRQCLNELKQHTDYFDQVKCPLCRTPIY